MYIRLALLACGFTLAVGSVTAAPEIPALPKSDRGFDDLHRALSSSAEELGRFRETVLHSFGSGMDGAVPLANVIDVNGTLYGTTEYGGYAGCDAGYHTCGTVFSLDAKTGAEKVLHQFCRQTNCPDGEFPEGGLANGKGKLYGTTLWGGANGLGTVFTVDERTGKERLLYSFELGGDAAFPAGDLIDLNGVLYGTSGGGANISGAVFAIDPNTGAERVVYSFCSQPNCTDGGGPGPDLIDVNGVLFGTTADGGTNGAGTVFALDPNTGIETVLYSFCSLQHCADGLEPVAGLIDVNAMFYGTTRWGGNGGCSGTGCGTVFALNPSTGEESVLYEFCTQQNCSDGAMPYANLIAVKGALYGTTKGGGRHNYGTVFAIDPKSGAEMVVHSFCSQQNCVDGDYPYASLLRVKDTLYGTTSQGGSASGCSGFTRGCGTVFALNPVRRESTPARE